MVIEAKLKEMGIELPAVPPLAGHYVRVKQVGDLLYVSGQGPTINGVPIIRGKVGKEVPLEDGYLAAKHCAINALCVLKDYLGDLDKIGGVVKILGFVASDETFFSQPKVVDGASVLLQELLGDDGIASRSAIGIYSLPDNIPVEVEFIFKLI